MCPQAYPGADGLVLIQLPPPGPRAQATTNPLYDLQQRSPPQLQYTGRAGTGGGGGTPTACVSHATHNLAHLTYG